MTQTVDLSGLRDIHQPIMPSWWPLAEGWWLLLGGLLLGGLLCGGLFVYWYTRPRQYALRALKHIFETEYNAVLLSRRISLLLKQVVLSRRLTEIIASDKEWRTYLKTRTGGAFSPAQLKLLTNAIYMSEKSDITVDKRALYQATRSAIQFLFKGEKHGY